MDKEEKMTLPERRKYLKMQQKRYERADKAEQTKLLNEMQVITGLHRKTLIRLMKSDLERKKRQKQRGKEYGVEVDDALRVIAKSYDYICAERMTPNLVKRAKELAAHAELELRAELQEQLEKISVSTVKRHMRRMQQDEPRLRRRRPSTRNAVAGQIPMRRIAWNEPQPGHFEVDLVHHSGPVTDGQYVHTIQMIDVTTGWSERVAILGRSHLVMKDGCQRIMQRLPFKVLEFHPDNGGEFLNQPLLSFWKDAVPALDFSRSRPYQKNDNRFVEQKNDSLVRAYFGHERFDTVAQTKLMNEIYDLMWLYYNFCQPVLRLKAKTYLEIEGQPRQVKREYDTPLTPFERLCATGVLSPERKEQLTQLRDHTNPLKLRNQIYSLLDRLLSLPPKTPGVTENVRETLLHPVPQLSQPLSYPSSHLIATF